MKSRRDDGSPGIQTLPAVAPTGLPEVEGSLPGAEAPGFMPVPLRGGYGWEVCLERACPRIRAR